MKLRINMLSSAETVKGQGVASAFREQVTLIQEMNEDFSVDINSRSGKFDIYHIHTVDPKYRLRMNKKHLNIMYVHFVPAKNDGSLKMPKLFEWIFKKYVEKTYRKADEIIVVNPCFIPELEKIKIPREKITYIPNFVDHDKFKPIERDKLDELKNKYGIPLNRFVVLGCGQIQTRKGFDDFVEVARQNPEMTFVWAGGFSFGRITDGYKKYKKLLENLPQNMIHLSIIERQYMNEVFNICDVLFMPSFIELFPMTILEACNVHKPFLVRDLDLYKPILFSKYCKGNSVEEFNNELRKLKNDTTYYSVSYENSKFISNFYNKDVLKKTWKDYYLRVYDKWISKKNKKKVK